MSMIDDTWYVRTAEAETRTGAGGVIARLDGASVVIALAREGDHDDLVLPKGGVEAGESLAEAAIREIEEEIGLSDLTLLAELGVRERLSFAKTRWVKTHYFLFLTRQRDAVPGHAERHWHGPTWIDVNDDVGLQRMFWPEQRELVVQHRGMIEEAVRAAAAGGARS